MKIVTWNVNSIRPRLERLKAFLERHQPDVVCLQETKVVDEDYPAAELEELGYHSQVFGQKTYNGVALLSRLPMSQVSRGFPGDPIPEQARVISAEVDGLRVVNLYVVNGQALDSPKFEIKLRWLDALHAWIEGELLPSGKPLILLGDFNIAPEDRDVHDPDKWRGKVHASEPERTRLHRLQDLGLADLLRLHLSDGGIYTWWDYRMGAFHRGWGLRIDLALGSPEVARRSQGVEIDREERKKSTGEGSPSDHAPVLVTLG
jgi:exodeoxyribonuclease-3